MSIAIEQALNTELINGGLDLDIVFDNGMYSTFDGFMYKHKKGVYTPSAERGYLESTAFPAGILPFSLKDSDKHVGVFQVIVKYPSDVGAITTKMKADEVLALFSIGSTVSYNGQDTRIDSKRTDGGRIEGGFFQVVVRFDYHAYVSR